MTERDECEIERPHQRDLVIAYLSYALEDVRALSKVSMQFLQMAIASLHEEPEESEKTAQPALTH